MTRRKANEDIIRLVGRRVAQLRQERMTQADFAEAMGTSVQWVSRVEVGENLTLTTLEKIAKVLQIPIESLLQAPSVEARVIRKGRPRKKTG